MVTLITRQYFALLSLLLFYPTVGINSRNYVINGSHEWIGLTLNTLNVSKNGYPMTPVASRVLLPQLQLERAIAHRSSFFFQGFGGGGTGVPLTI